MTTRVDKLFHPLYTDDLGKHARGGEALAVNTGGFELSALIIDGVRFVTRQCPGNGEPILEIRGDDVVETDFLVDCGPHRSDSLFTRRKAIADQTRAALGEAPPKSDPQS